MHSNKIPDDEGVALRDADGVLEDKLVELGGDGAEVEVLQAAAQAVRPDLLQRRHNGPNVGPQVQEALHRHHKPEHPAQSKSIALPANLPRNVFLSRSQECIGPIPLALSYIVGKV